LLTNVDVLTLHVPLTKFTKNLLSKKILVKMKKSACIVNTSRGEVINENDLIFLLKKNFFKNIALDVMSKEPYYGPLLKFENVSITPHNASMSFQSRKKMVEGTIQNIINFYQGKITIKN
jgi:lactate dehydrogenase-like 2-hydroxyacid dehydrogenase